MQSRRCVLRPSYRGTAFAYGRLLGGRCGAAWAAETPHARLGRAGTSGPRRRLGGGPADRMQLSRTPGSPKTRSRHQPATKWSICPLDFRLLRATPLFPVFRCVRSPAIYRLRRDSRPKVQPDLQKPGLTICLVPSPVPLPTPLPEPQPTPSTHPLISIHGVGVGSAAVRAQGHDQDRKPCRTGDPRCDP